MAENSSWATTFYHGQELRSIFMNGLLNSSLVPGIYNANLALITNSSVGDTNRAPGIYLWIGKGTTFCFSNAYDFSRGSGYTRNLDKIGEWLVKCTALEDIKQPLIKASADLDLATRPRSYLGTVTSNNYQIDRVPVSLVQAYITYDADQADSTVAPSFRVSIPTSYCRKTGSDFSWYDAGLLNENREENDILAFDDEIAYLNVGAIVATQTNQMAYTTDTGGWNINNGAAGNFSWLQHHIFTAQGFPEYTHDQITRAYAPSFMVGPNPSICWLTSSHYSDRDRLYKISGANWSQVYGQARLADGDVNTATPLTGCTNQMGFITTKKWNASGEIAEQSQPAFYEGSSSVSRSNKVSITLYYLTSRAGLTSYSTESILKSEVSSVLKKSDGSNGGIPKVVSIELLVDDPDYSSTSSGSITSDPYKSKFSAYPLIAPTSINPDTSNGVPVCIPLDVAKFNVERLRGILEGSNIMQVGIDYMRQHPSKYPYLTPQVATSLIPLAAALIKYDSNGDPVDPVTKNKFMYYTPAEMLAPSAVTKTPDTFCNPANIISYQDLQVSSNKITQMNITSQGYMVLPFLD